MSKQKEIIGNILFIFISAAITLGVLEGLLRFKNADQKNYTIEMWRYAKALKVKSDNPLLGHEHRPNKSATLQNTAIGLNSLGMRGPEVDLSDAQRKRILFLGSSNTLGWGVPEEKTMTGILREDLKNDAQVMNAGIGNYNTLRYVTLFKEKLRATKPDIVVVHYFIRDAEKLDAGSGNFILRHSQAAVMIDSLVKSIQNAANPPSLTEHYSKLFEEDYIGYQEMLEALKELDQMAKEDGFEIILAMTPESHYLKSYPFTAIHEKMKIIADGFGWRFVDFTKSLQTLPENELWVMPSDPHYSARAHKIMAETLLPDVKDLLQNANTR